MLTFQTTFRTHFRISTCHYQHCKDTHCTSKVCASSYFQSTVYVTHGNLDTCAHTKNKDLDIHWLSLKIKEFMWRLSSFQRKHNKLCYTISQPEPTLMTIYIPEQKWSPLPLALPCTHALLGFWGAEYLSLVLSLISTFLQASLICWGTNLFYLRLFNPYSQCPTWRKKF